MRTLILMLALAAAGGAREPGAPGSSEGDSKGLMIAAPFRDGDSEPGEELLQNIAAAAGLSEDLKKPGIPAPILSLPADLQYVSEPVVAGASAGRYRPYVPELDSVQAVMFAPFDPDRDSDKAAGYMTAENVMWAINKTAYRLSTLGVRSILVGNKGPSMRQAVADIRDMGADMSLIETFHKAEPRQNQNWFRDYGLLPLKDLATGEWKNVSMVLEGNDLSDLVSHAGTRFGLETIDSIDVSLHGGQLRGGNIMADGKGRCFSAGFRHPLFNGVFNCSMVVTLPCKSAVCHVDEYVTFLKNDTVVTNKEEFIPALKKAGYARILTVPDNKHLSLTNVLIVGNNVLMMYIKEYEQLMRQAKAVYESQGYKVFPIDSGGAGREYGAIHCLTREIPQ